MTFTKALIKSGYYFQPECDAYCKDDSNGNLHSYVEQENEEWSYEKYNESGQLVEQAYTKERKLSTPGSQNPPRFLTKVHRGT
jgi:YD repeat-containing protein